MNQKKFSILIADDDLDDQDFIKMAIKEVNCIFEVSSVYNGIQLMDFVLKKDVYQNIEENVDLLLLDLNMPRMGGLAVLRTLRDLDEKVPVMIITATVDKHKLDEVRELGICGILAKPFPISMIGAELMKHLT